MLELLPGIRQLGSGPPNELSSAAYIIGDGPELALVDAGSVEGYPDVRRELIAAGIMPLIRHVYLTHGHVDHYGGAALLQEEGDVQVHIGGADQAAAASGDYLLTAGFFYGRPSLPLTESVATGNGYERRFGNALLRAIETPGHTPGSVTYEVVNSDGVRTALLGDNGFGGWHAAIGSDLDAWGESIDLLLGRGFDFISFGHDVAHLVPGQQKLELLRASIGQYFNMYDHIPVGGYQSMRQGDFTQAA